MNAHTKRQHRDNSEKHMARARNTRRTVLCASVLLQLAFPPSSAFAASGADSAAAEALFERGRQLMAEGKPAEACPKFEESQRLDPGSGTLINLAECYERQGRIASAWGKYLEAAAAAQASDNAERARVAQARADALRQRLPRLSLSLAAPETPGLEVRRDQIVIGKAQWGIEMPLDPGQHTIEVTAPGRITWRQTVTASADAATTTLAVPELAQEPPAVRRGAPLPGVPSSPTPPGSAAGLGTQRTLAIVAASTAVVAAGVGTAFGVRSKSKHDKSFEICPQDPCRDQEGIDAMDSARSAGNISTASFIVAGAALAGGGILWFTAKNPSKSPPTQVGLGLGELQIRGKF
jgi:hypothetical protein